MKSKKCAIIGIDVSDFEIDNFAHGLQNMANYLDYELIITNKPVKSISIEDIRSIVK